MVLELEEALEVVIIRVTLMGVGVEESLVEMIEEEEEEIDDGGVEAGIVAAIVAGAVDPQKVVRDVQEDTNVHL